MGKRPICLPLAACAAVFMPLVSDAATDAEVEALLTEGRVVTLTDRYAPVDQMLMRVFLDQVPR